MIHHITGMLVMMLFMVGEFKTFCTGAKKPETKFTLLNFIHHLLNHPVAPGKMKMQDIVFLIIIGK